MAKRTVTPTYQHDFTQTIWHAHLELDGTLDAYGRTKADAQRAMRKGFEEYARRVREQGGEMEGWEGWKDDVFYREAALGSCIQYGREDVLYQSRDVRTVTVPE